MPITKEDFLVFMDLMVDKLGVRREDLRVSAYKLFVDGSTEYFEEAKIIATLESGIVVIRNEYEEDEEDYDESEEETVFVPWTSIDEIVIVKKYED